MPKKEEERFKKNLLTYKVIKICFFSPNCLWIWSVILNQFKCYPPNVCLPKQMHSTFLQQKIKIKIRIKNKWDVSL